jgi:hypothetical protein
MAGIIKDNAAIETAVCAVTNRINYGLITPEQYKDESVAAISYAAEFGEAWPLASADLVKLWARVLTRVALYYAEREELEALADPDPLAACMTITPDGVSAYGDPFSINRAQYDALMRKFIQNPDGSPSLEAFMARVRKGYDCLMLHWCNMWLWIEVDGHTHS